MLQRHPLCIKRGLRHPPSGSSARLNAPIISIPCFGQATAAPRCSGRWAQRPAALGGPSASNQQQPSIVAAAAPDGFDPPAGTSSDQRNGAHPHATGSSMYATDTFTSLHQAISFAEPAVQAGPSDGYMPGSSSRSAGSAGQQFPGSSSAGSSHTSHHDGQHAMQHHASPSPQPSLLASYSDYYRQQQLQSDTATPPSAAVSSSSTTIRPGTLPDQPSSPSSASRSPDPDSETASALSVAEALSRAQQALDKVESSLDAIDQLPSARPESKVNSTLETLRTVAAIGALSAALLASHAFGLIIQWVAAALAGAALGAYAYNKGSLSRSGAIAAFGVGLGTLGCSLRLGVTLLAFFFSSSKLTQYKEELKVGLDDQAKKGGQRDWVQVCCNALVPTVLAVVYGVLAGCVDVPLGPLPSLEPWRAKAVTALLGGFLGYYACCCGDTWASELGPLSTDTPRLITTLRPVRKGTNGGVTLLGLSASILGGAFIGATFYAAAVVSPTLFIFEQQHMIAIEQWKLLPLGLVAGLLGSVLDSVLGATLQYSGYNPATGRVTSRPGPGVQHIAGTPLLTNNAVNAVSATLTAAITALAALKAFGF